MSGTELVIAVQYLRMTPAFDRWKKSFTGDDDWQAFQSYISRVHHVVSSLEFLWPEFVDVDGLVLNKSRLPQHHQRYIQQFRAQGWSDSDIENVINHIHVADLFLNDPDRDEIDGRILSYIAQTMAKIWLCRLSTLYPDRRFVVGVTDEATSPEVYVYSVRD